MCVDMHAGVHIPWAVTRSPMQCCGLQTGCMISATLVDEDRQSVREQLMGTYEVCVEDASSSFSLQRHTHSLCALSVHMVMTVLPPTDPRNRAPRSLADPDGTARANWPFITFRFHDDGGSSQTVLWTPLAVGWQA